MRTTGHMNWLERLFIHSPLHAVELRRFAQFMLRVGGDVRGGKVLEIGCGRGMGVDILFELFHPAYVEAFDIDPGEVRVAQKRLLPRLEENVRVYEASATRIPTPERQFDAVFDFGALHHIPDNQRALDEVARVLKPGGRFFFQEPLAAITRRPLFHFMFGDLDEAQFTWDELKQKLTRSGLAVADDSCSVRRLWAVGLSRRCT